MANASPSPNTGEQDLSMEEILQSIRRIIAEEGDEAKPGAGAAPAKGGETATMPASDVFELTEMVQEDGSTQTISPDEYIAPPQDVLAQIDEALAPAAAPPVQEAPPPPPPPPPLPDEVPVMSAPPAMPVDDGLLSRAAAESAAASLKKIMVTAQHHPVTHASTLPFRSGTTVEDLVIEAIRPMLKEWLDANLPPMVEQMVEREIRKLKE